MTSADMMKLRSLYTEIDRCLERGDSAGAEIERLYAEVEQLVPADEEIWINVEPRGLSKRSAA